MRIIGGKYRGKTLYTLPGLSVRPTTDRTKEAVFNLIQSYIKDAAVLDLFAGSGALGIEALSRGADYAVFSDRSPASCETAKRNLAGLDLKYEIINKDWKAVIRELSAAGKKFDIIFLDPPYGEKTEDAVLSEIEAKGLLADEGVIVLERKRGDAPYTMPYSFGEVDYREYGATSISVIKRAKKAAVTGTFDPFTNGHLYLVETAAKTFDLIHIVILVNPDKKMTFNIERRMEFIKKAVKPYKKRIKVDFYGGLAIDYCRLNGIQYIIRGVRNPDDYKYESEMAAYNKLHGGVETLFIPAKDAGISSTLVKELASSGGSLEGLVSPEITKDIEREGQKWKT